MQHSFEELHRAALVVKLCYHNHTNRVSNVEFLRLQRPNSQGVELYFKGTSRNRGDADGGRWPLIRDIYTNLRFLPRKDSDYGLGWHPGGFLHAADDLIGHMVRNEDFYRYDRPIHLSGHSLGGAVILIAAPVLLAHGFQVESVITFGAPNVGVTPSMPSTTRVSCLRNGSDVVTKVPPFYGGTYKTHDIGESVGFIADHRIDRYVATLARLKEMES